MAALDWYVLQVRGGKEADVQRDLSRHGLHAISPARVMLEQRSGKWKEITRYLLPGYVFLQMTMNVRQYEAVRATPGVVRFLGTGMPETVPQAEMARMYRLDNGGEPWGLSTGHMDGKTLMIDTGPLAGWEPMVLEIDARRHRAKVQFTLLGTPKAVELALTLTSSPQAQKDDTSPKAANGEQEENPPPDTQANGEA